METKTVNSNQTNKTENAITGELTYKDKVIQKIIGYTLEDIDGLLTVDGGFFSNIAEKIVNNDNQTAGVGVEVGKEQVAVDLDIVAEYGKDISKIYDEIKDAISASVKEMTHLDVIEVNVTVVDIKTAEQYEQDSISLQDRVVDGTNVAADKISESASKASANFKSTAKKISEENESRVN